MSLHIRNKYREMAVQDAGMALSTCDDIVSAHSVDIFNTTDYSIPVHNTSVIISCDNKMDMSSDIKIMRDGIMYV